MVTIIVSTYQSMLFSSLKKNIEETIGVPHQIVGISNRNEMGICAAYNFGAKQALFSYLCFVHEDVVFRTKNWGLILIEKFKHDPETGLIGVAGSTYKSIAPSKGWYSGISGLDKYNIFQNDRQTLLTEQENHIEKDFEQVVCLDGVFLFTKKNIWEINKFDEARFKNFHCYDLDFSLSVNRRFKVYATKEVLLEHFSRGNLNKQWLAETLILSKKWEKELPVGSINKNIQQDLEWGNKMWFLLEMKKYNYSIFSVLEVLFNYGFIKFFSLNKSLKVLKLLLTLYFKHAKSFGNYSKL